MNCYFFGADGVSSPFLENVHTVRTPFLCPSELFITFPDVQMGVQSGHQTGKQTAERISKEPLT